MVLHTERLFAIFSALVIASRSDDLAVPESRLLQSLVAREGQVQIFNIFHPPHLGVNNKTHPNCQCSTSEEWYLIRHCESGFAVEAGRDYRVAIQKVTHHDEQLWKFEPVVGTPGFYYIVNKLSRKVLEAVRYGADEVLVKEKSEIPEQHWLVGPQGRLYNHGLELNLDVKKAELAKPGTPLQIWVDNGNPGQTFSFEWEHEEAERVGEDDE